MASDNKFSLKPTPNQTFEIVGRGDYDFAAILRHSYQLQEQEQNIEAACNERFHAFQRLVEMIPEDEDIILEWEHAPTRAALELIYASAVDHFLINDFEMAAGMFEMLLELDPEDHTGCIVTLAFCCIAMEEYELYDEVAFDISDKQPEKYLLTIWSEFRRTGAIPVGELRHLATKHKSFFEEFRATEHPIDDAYLKGLEAESPTREAQARQLWLQTENLWSLFPEFIAELRK